MAKQSEYTLDVGEDVIIKKSIFSNTSIIYAGMLDEDTYSFVVTFTQGYNSMSYNLYFSSRQREIIIEDKSITIYQVNPVQIRLRTN
jgi:hypothetical protein